MTLVTSVPPNAALALALIRARSINNFIANPGTSQRPICFEGCERIAHDLFDCNNEELRTDVRPRPPFCLATFWNSFIIFPGQSAHKLFIPCSAELGSKRFGKTCHIRLRSGVNSGGGNWDPGGGELTLRTAPRCCAIIRGST